MPYRAVAVAAALWVLFALAPPARAQGPEAARLAAAKEMMQVAGVAKQFDEVMPLLARQLSQSFVALSPDKAFEIREVFDQLVVRFVDRKSELIDQIATLYAEKLELEDLSAIIGFYKSPAGVKFIGVQPDIMRQSMIFGQRWGAQIGRELEEEARRELKKRGIQL